MAKAEKVTRKVVDLHAAARAIEVKGGRPIQASSKVQSSYTKTADARSEHPRLR
jgi:hypothetical protein